MTPQKQTLWLTFLSFAPSAGDSKGIEDMDMNVVRLCFQCEFEWDDGRKDCLSPVVSNPIYDKSKSSPNTHLQLLTTVWTSAFKNVFLGSHPLLHVFLFSQRPLLHHSSRSAVWTSTEVPVTARRKFTCFVTKCRKVCFICGLILILPVCKIYRLWTHSMMMMSLSLCFQPLSAVIKTRYYWYIQYTHTSVT